MSVTTGTRAAAGVRPACHDAVARFSIDGAMAGSAQRPKLNDIPDGPPVAVIGEAGPLDRLRQARSSALSCEKPGARNRRKHKERTCRSKTGFS